jgi:hypothetical protein
LAEERAEQRGMMKGFVSRFNRELMKARTETLRRLEGAGTFVFDTEGFARGLITGLRPVALEMQNAECKMQNAKKGQGHGLTSSFAEASTFAEPTADRTADRESRPALPCPAQPRLICSSRHHFFDKVSRAHCKNCPAAAVSP